MRVLLWDVDGTLVSSRGAGMRALALAVRADLPATQALGRLRLNGMTDRKIARFLCAAKRHHDRPDLPVEAHESAVTAGEIDAVLSAYLAALATTSANAGAYRVQPGVWEILDALGPSLAVHGLGTGNIEAGARAKLEPLGLWSRFAFGGFGSDAEERVDVLRAGRLKAERHLGRPCAADELVIIGDTPRDVAAAHAAGFACVAVATGGHTASELADAGADLVLASLAEDGVAARILAVRRRT